MIEETTTLPEKQMVMQQLINSLYGAFKFFNGELFNNLLPDCSISIGIKKGASGVYYAERFVPKDIQEAVEKDTSKLDEIMLNPISFDLDETYVLSTLVHEMIHEWEHEYGKPGKDGYHNREWGESMKAIGLMPSATGEPGGKQTGRRVSHYIMEGGLFEKAAAQFIEETEFSIEWIVIEKPPKKTTPRKCTYRCGCPQPWYSNLSGRKASCGECFEDFQEDKS